MICLDPKSATTYGFSDFHDHGVNNRIYIELEIKNKEKSEKFL